MKAENYPPGFPLKAQDRNIGSIQNHRRREHGAIVYPVYSRRSGGLSLGINLFPDKKVCSFDCPYCEVFPFETDIRFSLELMEEALRESAAYLRSRNIPIRDICFSGNGEPTMSPHFPAALDRAALIRDELADDAKLVVISNGTSLSEKDSFEYLEASCSGRMNLDLWLKIDAGSEAWYRTIGRSAFPFDSLLHHIKEFAAKAPFTIQTMLCRIGGHAPSAGEASSWIRLIIELAGIAQKARGIRAVQLYGKARPAPEDPYAEALPEQFLQARAASLGSALADAGFFVPVEVYP